MCKISTNSISVQINLVLLDYFDSQTSCTTDYFS
uniref:Uncharacterized protein n=1 Tax=Anguilla anguilla TaxID=7936 RepID=A0A0E9Y2C5_ANGAN